MDTIEFKLQHMRIGSFFQLIFGEKSKPATLWKRLLVKPFMSYAFKYYRNSEIHYSSDSSDSSESRDSSGEVNDSLVSSLDHGDREITQKTVQV